MAIERINAVETAERAEAAESQVEQERYEEEAAAERAKNDPRRLQLVRDIEVYKFNLLQLLGKDYFLQEIEAAGFKPQLLNSPPADGRALIRTKNVSVEQLRAWNYADRQIFTVSEMKAQGLTLQQLRVYVGFPVSELKAAGFSSSELKAAGFSLSELKAAGFSLSELKAAGFSLSELKAAGFQLSDFKDVFAFSELKNVFLPIDLVKSGFELESEFKDVLPIRISGGPSRYMGVYLPTKEQSEGLPVYRLQSNDKVFLRNERKDYWWLTEDHSVKLYIETTSGDCNLPQVYHGSMWGVMDGERTRLSIQTCAWKDV